MSNRMLLTAEWVLPIASPPIRDGAVLIEGNSIALVGKRDQLARDARTRDVTIRNLGSSAILPGFINAHAHLELTVMRGFLEELPFLNWIMKLTRARAERLRPEDLRTSAMLGAAEAIRAGITTIADTGDSPAPFEALLSSGLRGIAYREVFGPDPAVAGESLKLLESKVEMMRACETERVKVGVSPHAPFTVSSKLFQLVDHYSKRESLDVCIHAAESQEELKFVRDGEGVFAQGYAARGIAWQASRGSTIRYLENTGILDRGPLLVHCVTANDEDITAMAQRGARVAHCPKSNAKLGHGVAPLRSFMADGVAVGLGTDSVASNNRLDMIDEMRMCGLIHRSISRNYQSPSAGELLRLATIDSARVLGIADKAGTIEVGKRADIIAVEFTQSHSLPVYDPEQTIVFSSSTEDVCMTMVDGEILFDSDEIKSFDERAIQVEARETALRLRDF